MIILSHGDSSESPLNKKRYRLNSNIEEFFLAHLGKEDSYNVTKLIITFSCNLPVSSNTSKTMYHTVDII